ncbi:MAG: sulfatase-like hydrolase/transferase [Candidatus Promineifilaceae bacterium]
MRQPNVVLLILDAVRAGSLSAYGHPGRTSPHLDRLAADGWLFKRAFAPATWTIPSHHSLLTSLYPSQPNRDLGYLA